MNEGGRVLRKSFAQALDTSETAGTSGTNVLRPKHFATFILQVYR